VSVSNGHALATVCNTLIY